MLHAVLPGAIVYQRGHRYRVKYRNLIFTGFPKGVGPTGQPMNEVYVRDDQIRSMCRVLGILPEDCDAHLPGVHR